MRLHYKTVSPSLVKALKRLMAMPSLKDFVLVGGTNLALQRGHRVSIDIDLFSDKDIKEIDLNSIAADLASSFKKYSGLEALKDKEAGYHLLIGDTENELLKLDLWFVDTFVFPINEVDGIRLADIREIAAFKLQAATQDIRRQKDFWDIHELLDVFSLEQMITFAEVRYPYNFNREQLMRSLETSDTVELAPEGIKCLRGNYWELIVLDLQLEVQKMNLH